MSMTQTNQQDPTLKAWADISLSLGNLERHARKQAELAKQKLASLPVDATRSGAGATGAMIGLGGPTHGHQWVLRRFSLCGVTPQTTVTGRVDLFVGSSIGSAYEWVYTASTLPVIEFWSAEQIVVQSNQDVWFQVSNGTAGQQVVGVIAFREYKVPGVTPETLL